MSNNKEEPLKRLLLCVMYCILTASLVYAQEAGPEAPAKKRNAFVRFWKGFTESLLAPQIHKPFSVAGGIEMTQNDRVAFLPEIFVISDYELSPYFGIGVRGGLTFGSREPEDRLVSVMDGVVFGRFYVYDFGWIKPFIQTGVGISIDQELEYKYTDISGEFAAGVRAHWKGWFLETAFRCGYPFRLACGMSVGHSFLP
jgi:hypothetical protein